MKKFLKEFKEFAMRGNVLDMAVGVIVGAAFKTIIDSLVNDVISPLIGLVFKADFSNWSNVEVTNANIYVITLAVSFLSGIILIILGTVLNKSRRHNK